MEEFKIRNLKAEEMQFAMEWAAREGWNPGLHDGKCFYANDPEGFFVGLLGDKMVSMISALKYGSNYGFIGFYIADPEFRGKGDGLKIWNAAIKYLYGRMIGLDGVPAQVENYKKSGFVFAHTNISYSGVAKHFNIEAMALAKEFNREYSSETARMYKSGIPKLDINKIFGLTTCEVG